MLPKQLQNPSFNFIHVEGKNPAINGAGWQKQIHSYHEAETWLSLGLNYGVMGGHGGLLILDADAKAVETAIEAKLPETFTVKTGSGKKHYYYLCPELEHKIVMDDLVSPTLFVGEEDHYGEGISWGFQAVGPGSIHPTTQKPYEVLRDAEIAQVNKEEVLSALSAFLPKNKGIANTTPVERTANRQFTDDDGLISGLLIQDTIKVEKTGNIIHPIHGAKNGGNLNLNLEKNAWYCFRCKVGGGALGLLAVVRGLADCRGAGGKSLKGDLFKDTLKILKDEMALRRKEPSTPQAKEPEPAEEWPIPLMELTVPIFENQWIWEGYISRSKITMFFATWKAGKTTFYTHLLRAIEKGSSFVGSKTNTTKTLVISEEDKGTWTERRENYGFGVNTEIHSQPFRSKPDIKSWCAYMARMAEYCSNRQIDLVIIDAIANLWPVDNENDSAKVVEGMQPLREFTKRNIAVVAIHHPKKEMGDIDNAMRGSGAFGAFCDAYMVLTRVKGNNNQREINVRGRSGFTTEKTIIEMKDAGKKGEEYIRVGTAGENYNAKGREIILSVLRANMRAMNMKEIHTDCSLSIDPEAGAKKLSLPWIYGAIGSMVNEGLVEEIVPDNIGSRGQKARLYQLTERQLFNKQNSNDGF